MFKRLVVWWATRNDYIVTPRKDSVVVPRAMIKDLRFETARLASRWDKSGHVNGELIRRRPKIVRDVDRGLGRMQVVVNQFARIAGEA